MKKVRFTIKKQFLIIVGFLAIFPIFEGFLLYNEFYKVIKDTNPIVAINYMILKTFGNPFIEKRGKKDEENLKQCIDEASIFVEYLLDNYTEIDSNIIKSAFEDVFSQGTIITENNFYTGYNSYRYRFIGTDRKLISDSADMPGINSIKKVDDLFRHAIAVELDANDVIFNGPVFSGHDYYDSPFYKDDFFNGKEFDEADKNGFGKETRWSLDYRELVVFYYARTVYAKGKPVGYILGTKNFYNLPYRFIEWLYLFSYFCFISILISIPLIILLNFRLSHPITKLSKQTSSVLDKTGKITTTEFAYKKRRDEIGDLSRSFSTLIKKINDQMQAVEANTSDMVHEFKNPLAAIRSSMELLDFDDVSGEERKEILDSVHSELKHLEILLNDIRAHSKIQNLNNEADKENVPVGILAENIISRIRKNYPSVDFEFICENKEDTIFAKPENLDKMIGNLVENAASFAVNSEKKQVLVRIKSIKDIQKIKTIMRIDVEDSGPGVPESEIEKIFGRYYSHREDSQRKSHSGLGLSMVKAVAESLNATISVLKSGKLGGAKFVVSIPLFDEVEEIRK